MSLEAEFLKFMQVLEHNSTDPQRGALDAILQSGELRYISNPTIRERLAEFSYKAAA